MRIILAGLTTIFLAGLCALPGLAQSSTSNRDVVVENAWTRASLDVGGAVGVYFTLRNKGEKTVDLIGVRADVASIEVLHRTEDDAYGAIRMRAVPELRVAPGAIIALEPGGTHMMLIDLEKPLIEGETLRLRLAFYDGDKLSVDVPILAADATGPQDPANFGALSSD